MITDGTSLQLSNNYKILQNGEKKNAIEKFRLQWGTMIGKLIKRDFTLPDRSGTGSQPVGGFQPGGGMLRSVIAR